MLVRTPFPLVVGAVTRVVALLAALCFGLLAPAAPVPRERVPPDDAAVKKRFYDCWREEWRAERAPSGALTVETRPLGLIAYQFGAEGGWVWSWSGELSPVAWYPIKLDTTRTPMRCDTIATDKNEKPKSAIPGIFKFDGPRLILAYPVTNNGWRPWSASGEYVDRPKDFEPRPGVVIAVMERCDRLEQYAPPEQVPQRP